MLSVNFDSIPVFLRFAFCASSQDEGSIFRNFGNVAFTELIVRADFYDFEAFLDEERRELPELFKASVAVEDSRKIFGGMICCNSEIVCHCFFLLCGKFFDDFVGVRQPDFIDVVQNVVARFVVVFSVALQNFVVAERIFERHKRGIRLLLCTDKEDKRFLADKALIVIHAPHAVIQQFAFADQVGRGAGDDTDKGGVVP